MVSHFMGLEKSFEAHADAPIGAEKGWVFLTGFAWAANDASYPSPPSFRALPPWLHASL